MKTVTRRAVLRIVGAAACVIGAIDPSILAQLPAPASQTAPQFEVASVRPHKNTPPVDSVRLNLLLSVAQTSRNGIFNIRGVPLSVLTRLAYNVKDFQVIGLPGWASVEGYDISAKASTPAPFEQMRPMLQAVLAERFNLAFHKETRELPVYELELAKGGSKLERTTGGCMPDATPPPKAGEPPAPLKTCGGVRRMSISSPRAIERVEMYGVPVSKLVEMLADEVGRTVVDKTGLEGDFNVRLNFAPLESGAMGPAPAISRDAEPLSGPDAVSIFTAVQSQLGLRLKPSKGSVPVMVIDRVERPGEN